MQLHTMDNSVKRKNDLSDNCVYLRNRLGGAGLWSAKTWGHSPERRRPRKARRVELRRRNKL